MNPVVELTSVTKQYGALRPLRIERLVVSEGESVALLGLDQPAAEVLANLVTGASLPDTGRVRAFGRSTTEITDSSEWLASLDRFGIVSERAALLEQFSVIQNLTLPFSLEIERPPEDVRRQAQALAQEVGLPRATHEVRAGELDPSSRLRLRLGRALALDPVLVLLEHPSAALPRREATIAGRDIRNVLEHRRAAALTVTADRDFAAAVARHVFALDAATGRLSSR